MSLPSVSFLPSRAKLPAVFGLTGEERLRRACERAGVREIAARPDAPLGPDARRALFRCDHVYDERLVDALLAAPDTLLVGPGGEVLAAHVGASHLVRAVELLEGKAEIGSAAGGLRQASPEDLVGAYDAKLRKAAAPLLCSLRDEAPDAIEERLFEASYKGITDFVTKFVWPAPALRAVRLCVRAGISPNAVTLASWGLVLGALALFAAGHFATGLVAAWAMTFLDTVDGKLARVTLRSSRVGHVLDHGLDLIHPPFWYAAWAWALAPAPWLPLAVWVTLGGYLVHRAIEGLFLLLFRTEIHAWRPVDAAFRLVTTRRNPNLVLLTAGTLAGRPDLGFAAVAVWTAVSIAFHVGRLAWAVAEMRRGRPIQPWRQTLAGAAAAVLLLLAPAVLRAEPATGDPAARLPRAELGSDFWDLTIQLESGHRVFAQAAITNIGIGDRNAAVVGYVVEPGGRPHQFQKAKLGHEWELSEDRRRMDLNKILLDQSGPTARFYVNRSNARLDLRIEMPERAVGTDLRVDREYGFDLLTSSASVRGQLWTEGMPAELEVSGRAALTHRWMPGVESRFVERRLELFVSRPDIGVYFAEVTPAEGPPHRWLVVERDGRVVTHTHRVSARVEWSAGEDGPPLPLRLALGSRSVSGRVELGGVLVRHEPLRQLPNPFRWIVARLTDPRFVYSDARVELRVGRERLSGAGVSLLSRFDRRDRLARAPSRFGPS